MYANCFSFCGTPDPLPEFAPGLDWALSSPKYLSYSSQMKVHGSATDGQRSETSVRQVYHHHSSLIVRRLQNVGRRCITYSHALTVNTTKCFCKIVLMIGDQLASSRRSIADNRMTDRQPRLSQRTNSADSPSPVL